MSQFEEMLLYVYEKDPVLNSQRDALRIANEKVAQAVAGYRPTLSANAGTGKQRQEQKNADRVSGNATNASLVATQPVFSGFSTRAQRAAADERMMAERARLLAVEQNIFLLAISDWLEICEKQKILSYTEDNLRSMRDYAQATETRFKAGDGTQTDIAQAQSRLAQAEARFAATQAQLDSARASFMRNTGLVAPAMEFPPAPESLPTSAEETQDLARDNPELMQAAYEEKAAEQDIEYTKSSLYPNVYVRGSVSKEDSPNFGLERVRNDSITLNVSIPLYQGGGEYSRVREAKYAREKTREQARDTGRNVLLRAQQSWYNYHAAQTVIEASARASEAADRALSGVQEEQKQGLRTLTDVLDEQLELLNTQISETSAQKNLRLEAYRLLASVGKLTASAQKLPVPNPDLNSQYDEATSRLAGY